MVLSLSPWRRCVPRRGGVGAPPRVPRPFRAARAAVSRPLPSRAAAWRWRRAGTGSGRLARGALPRGAAPGWPERTEVGETGSRGGGPVGLRPPALCVGGGPGSWGGSPRVLRPAGVPGVAGPPSCWWRWDPVHVYPVARLASSLAAPFPEPAVSPRARARRLLPCVRPLPAASGSPSLPRPGFGRLERARVRFPLLFSSLLSSPSASGRRSFGLAVVGCSPDPSLGRHGFGLGGRVPGGVPSVPLA